MNSCCDKWCEGCEYLSKGGEVCCDYFTKTGMRRGCPAGTGCDKRRRPEKVNRDARLKSQEQMQKAQLIPPPPKPPGKPGRPRGTVDCLDPSRVAARAAARKKRLIPMLVGEQREAIQSWRKSLGLTQRAAGALLGVTGSTVGHWEAGEERANWTLLEKHGCKRPK